MPRFTPARTEAVSISKGYVLLLRLVWKIDSAKKKRPLSSFCGIRRLQILERDEDRNIFVGPFKTDRQHKQVVDNSEYPVREFLATGVPFFQ